MNLQTTQIEATPGWKEMGRHRLPSAVAIYEARDGRLRLRLFYDPENIHIVATEPIKDLA